MDFLEALKGTEEIELTIVGRRSGRPTSRPVWFAQDGDTVYLLPVTGSDSAWYRSVLENLDVRLTANGVTWTGRAIPISDPAEVHQVVDKFRAKYADAEVKKYYSKFDVAAKVPLR